MCGIFGEVYNPAITPDRIDRNGQIALWLMRRRGPDGRAYWHDHARRTWLGFARLSIMDLSDAGMQPMCSPDGRVVCIFNGEIYNFPELRAEMEAAGETFSTSCDAEVLLRLFAREGKACFGRLNGIFAAAFYERDHGRLTLVRDPMGVKPLYLDQRGGRFAFASEMKALLRTSAECPSPNNVAVMQHIAFLWVPGTETIVEGITKLLPGQVLERDAEGRVSYSTYADPRLPSQTKLQVTPEEASNLVHEALKSAVERQLLSDAPLGAFLSGGVDSSAICAFANRADQGPPLKCFTIEISDYDGKLEGHESDFTYAKELASALNFDLHAIPVEFDVPTRLAEMIYFLDEPTADMAAVNTQIICSLAREAGLKVLLSGSGGDDVFTGYRRHWAIGMDSYLDFIPRPLRRLLANGSDLFPKHSPAMRRAAKLLQNIDGTPEERLIGYFHWLQSDDVAALMNKSLDAEAVSPSIDLPLYESLARLPRHSSPLEAMLYVDRSHFLVDHNLNYTDKMGMAENIEIRVPFLDPDLMALANQLPDNLKQHGKTGKWVLRKALENVLPRSVLTRSKSGFGVPMRRWLATSLSSLMDDLLSETTLAKRGLFDFKAVNNLVHRARVGQVDASYSIFAVACIELWCRQYVDGHYAVDGNIDEEQLNAPCVKLCNI